MLELLGRAKLAFERVTGGVKVIDTDHAMVHEKKAFSAHIELATLPATVEYLFMASAELYIHFKNIRLQAVGGTVRMTVLRGATITDPGTSGPPDLIGPNNLNDALGAPASTVAITKGVTYTGGTVWDILKVLGSSTNQFVSVAYTQMSPNYELAMRRSAPYILRIEKVGADTPANVTVNMFWYEEDWV